MDERKRMPNYLSFWKNADLYSGEKEKEVIAEMEHIVKQGTISDKNLLLAKLMDYPQILPAKQGIAVPPPVAIALAILFPLGLLLYLYACYQHRLFVQDMKTTLQVNEELMKIVTDIKPNE